MFHFSTVEEALDSLRKGRIILVTDDEDRENEGDFICAAQYATTENVNFMAVHGKGLICMPMSRELCQKLAFPQMNAGPRPGSVRTRTQNLRISAGLAICSP